MGCDIHVYTEVEIRGQWFVADIPTKVFDYRSYATFAFLAGVRNYSDITPFSEPRGLPEDAAEETRISYEESDHHSASWLSIDELAKFNYDALMEDRRVMRQISPGHFDGGCTAPPGEGRTMTYREFLGTQFFKDLEAMKYHGIERIVFWFAD